MELKQELMDLEEKFWKADSDFYERRLTDESLLVFQDPVGVLTKRETVASLAGAPRWTEVAFRDPHVAELGEGVALLSYRARARREPGDPEYVVLASSVYVRGGPEGPWRLAFHQQTPGGED